MKDPTEINAALSALTILERLEFTSDFETGRCSVVLQLVDNEHGPRERLVLMAEGVANWSVARLGGGITQLLCLRLRAVDELQHDRIRLVLEDLENQAFSLRCEALTATRLSPDF